MRAQLSDEYVFLNPRIYRVKWQAHTNKESEKVEALELHLLFWGVGSLSEIESEISYAYTTNYSCLRPKAVTHLLKCKEVKDTDVHLPDLMTGTF